ncbi:MAG: 6-phosphogluconate dehydrogenase [Lewinellaceae bacterium]|nr:6-phosphogluconate dehydrogenase [Lewinellaceae bacterium]
MSVQLDQVKQKARRVFRITMWSALVAGLLFAAGYYIYRTYTISEGSRTGILYKVSKKGVMFKTYEGQLLLAGSVMMTQQSTWDFSAQNGKVYEDLQKLEGKTIKCHYRQKVDAFTWQGDTDYIVYKVELAQ